MSTYDIPPRIVSELDQTHAAADATLGELLDVLVADGIAALAAPERTIGVALELRALDRADLVGIAATAVARLLGAQPVPCDRCNGTGTVHVRHYGGHDVNCGICGGTGQADPIERTSG